MLNLNFFKKQKFENNQQILDYNLDILFKKGLKSAKVLILDEDINSTKLKSLEDIYRRAFCLCMLGVKSENMSDDVALELVERFDFRKHFLPEELEFLESKDLSHPKIIKHNWGYESSYALCWVIGLVKKIGYPKDVVNVAKFTKILAHKPEDVIQKAKYKDIVEIIQQQDLHTRLLWNYRQSKIDNQIIHFDFDSSVVQTRLEGLRWAAKVDAIWGDGDLVGT
ncbi:MAG: DUF4272 domain-containing protein [bacterium]